MVNRGIPTMNQGIQFRSRLEARWASFFTMLGWPWEYEPFDLNGYIPDFVLKFEHSGKPAPVLVEVKPSLYVQELHEHTGKIEKSGWSKEALIVGGALFDDDEGCHVLGITTSGWKDEQGSSSFGYWVDAHTRFCEKIDHGHAGLTCAEGSWHCRVCGVGGKPWSVTTGWDQCARHWWKEAQNQNQWRSPR